MSDRVVGERSKHRSHHGPVGLEKGDALHEAQKVRAASKSLESRSRTCRAEYSLDFLFPQPCNFQDTGSNQDRMKAVSVVGLAQPGPTKVSYYDVQIQARIHL